MQFFDLSTQFNLNDILQGQAVLKSNQNIEVELEWQIVDTGHELQVLFKGIETITLDETFVVVKGVQIIEENQCAITSQVLSLWIDGTLLPLLPNIRQDIKARLNLWDYVQYDG